MIRAFAVSAVLLATASAYAEPTEIALRAAELFDLGLERKRAGDLDGACAAFTESQALAPAHGTQLNIAACLERDGKVEAARALLRDTAAEAAARGNAVHAAGARADLEALERRHPRQFATAPEPRRAPTPATTRPPPRRAEPAHTRSRLPLALGAGSVILGIAGSATLISAHRLQSAADAVCPDRDAAVCDRVTAQAHNDAAVVRSRLGAGILIGGGALAAAAVYVWRRDRRTDTVRPGLTPTSGGAMLTLAGVLP